MTTPHTATQLMLPELITRGISEGTFPRYLYKYRADNENTDKILTKSQLWYAKPQEFNDPFDCKTIVDVIATKAQIEDWLRDSYPTMDRNTFRAQTREFVKDPSSFARAMRKSSSMIVESTGICCFAQTNDNILMWSHYADSHKGLCMKFDLLEDPGAFVFLLKVEYSTEYPRFNSITEKEKGVSLFKVKALNWEYEQEWRVMKYRNAGAHSFAKRALCEISFGCKAEKKFIDKIKLAADTHGFKNIAYKKMQKNSASFSLVSKPLN